MTIEEKIKIAEIISKSSKHTLPYVLATFGIEYKDITPPTKQNVPPVDESVTGFLKDIGNVANSVSAFVYMNYVAFCRGNGAKPINHIEFARQVNRMLGTKSKNKRINGKVTRIFAD